MALSARRERFAREYAVDNNGKQAAIRAGYAAPSAEVQASRLLRDAQVAARVAELQAMKLKQLDISAEDIARRAWEIAQQDDDRRASVSALALLSKRHPEFSEKHQVTGADGGPVIVERRTRGIK